MAKISLQKLRKSYDETEAVRGIDLEIEHNEFVVLVGPSGCGKSTTLRMVAGLEEITGGEITIGDRVVNRVPPKDRDIAMVFQNYALYPHMTVFENMSFGLRLRKLPADEISKRVTEAAEILNIGELLERRPKQLSGGQRQRVAMGRAIVRHPQAFLFDEPLSNLDAKLRVQMRTEIKKIHQRVQTTVVYVTHDQVEAMTLADKIVVLNEGNLEQVGSPLDLYHRPRNLFVAGFIGSPRMNFLEARCVAHEDGTLTVALAGEERLSIRCAASAVREGDRLTVGVRPEHVCEPDQATVSLRGSVDVVERLGTVSYVYATLADGAGFVASSAGTSRTRAGEERAFGLDRSTVHLFDGDWLALDNLDLHPDQGDGAGSPVGEP